MKTYEKQVVYKQKYQKKGKFQHVKGRKNKTILKVFVCFKLIKFHTDTKQQLCTQHTKHQKTY